jgi:S-adenosylmethionine:tRNA ribosyltransferase-isomerase
MHPKELPISLFTYDLPEDRIAKFPAEERDCSKLLVFKSGEMSTSIYRNLDEFLPKGSLLVFNNTKVVEARLLFQKPTGALIEIFCLEPGDQYPDITTAMREKGKVLWKCLIGGASKWKHGTILQKSLKAGDKEIILEAAIVDRLPDCFIISLSWTPSELSFSQILEIAGKIPLPPYIHRPVEETDQINYQTVYAKYEGSVAAPTAGLHFTDQVFEKLNARKINCEFVTLHVGAGTFKPVKSETMNEHEMHAEFIDVSSDAIRNIRNNLSNKIFAVGTTSLRTLESLYWMGLKVNLEPDLTMKEISISQWEPYEISQRVSAKEALGSLLQWMDKNGLDKLITKTQILIAPGYKLKVAKGIITNFHQPQSTLLLLIAAIVGEKWKEIYQYALDNEFRFLSYGDGCLLYGD